MSGGKIGMHLVNMVEPPIFPFKIVNRYRRLLVRETIGTGCRPTAINDAG
jgi:hypothetical protein